VSHHFPVAAGPERRQRVLALAKYGGRAASTRQRLLQYAPYLAAHGVDIDVHPLLGDAYLEALMAGRTPSRVAVAQAYMQRLRALLTVRNYDVLWIQYEMFPYLPLLDGVVARLAHRPILYDIDDAIFHMYDAHTSATVRRFLSGKLRPLMRRASLCLCGNAYLADYVTAAGGRAVVIPTVVDTDHFRPAPREFDAPLVVGWIGSPSTWTYVEPLLPLVLPTMERLGARFRVVGAGPRARGIAGIDAIEWSEDREVADIQAMDIGLMPVPDEPWARGKCGYKLIQYMACSIPGIGSPVGVNNTIIEPGIDGFLAQNDADWVTALATLAGDAGLRRRMGAAGRAKIIASYSLATQQPAMLAALRVAVAGA
jgi:glycosyltransferase involved in cell wall biosynthesis